MPVYEYECTKCNEQFEVMQKITDDPLAKCSSCGGELKKLITNTSFVLKGSGWYVTDYPSADRKKAMEAKKPATAGKDSKSEKKPDTKKKAVNA
ncbi:MAG TPA: zinc ribbon domain-containing protein [Nitrospirae bacterium]|nr:zinc ribbon domain-containing protein [Nitrospirota bacterium]HDZ02918.1 zinc ribbon domain-containing protein [Nitrospirota bacterium]